LQIVLAAMEPRFRKRFLNI